MDNKDVISRTDLKKGRKTIVEEIKSLAIEGLTTDIINIANEIFLKIPNNSRKSKKRKQLLFFCVYSAYKQLSINVDPFALGKHFSLKRGETMTAITLYDNNNKKAYSSASLISMVDMVRTFCRDNKMSDEFTQGALSLCQEINDKKVTILIENPRSAAAGFLKYYLELMGQTEIAETLHERVLLSKATLDKMKIIISGVDNN